MQQTAYARIANERRAERRRGPAGSVKKTRSLVDGLKDLCRKTIAFLFTQVGVCALLITYNIIGAFCFRELEGVHGDSSVEDTAAQAQDHLVETLWNLTVTFNVLNEELWRTRTSQAVAKYQEVLVPLIRWKGYRAVMPVDAWSIPAALMYSLSIYTTIGYGNLIPRTEAGKLATIFYAFIGMPLMLLYMSNVGEALASVFKFIYFRMCSCEFHSNRAEETPVHRKHLGNSHDQVPNDVPAQIAKDSFEPQKAKRPPGKLGDAKTIPILWCLLVVAVYVFIGGVLFSHWEGWSLLNGCYFCYISLSTVGFGDLVPGRVIGQDDLTAGVETRQVMATIYLLVGMALVAMCFNLMQEEALESLKTFWRAVGFMREKREKKPKKSELNDKK